MSLQNKLYEKAKEELDVYEWFNGENPRIIEYHQCTSLKADTQAIPWCSSFVNFICKECSVKGTNSAAARSFLNWGVEVKDPQEGDLVVIQRGVSQASGHVGFVVKIQGDKIFILGGNQSDRVCVMPYKRSSVISFRRARPDMFISNLN